jgi:hypothetical protein
MNFRLPFVVLFAALVLLPAPVRAGLDEAGEAELVGDLRAYHILPRYEALATRTREMRRYATALCTLPDDAHLVAMREAFADAYLAWMGVQHIDFGPVAVSDRFYRIQFWPDKHGRGGRQLSALLTSDDPLPDAEGLAGLSAAIQGFPALERLLYDGDAEDFADAAGARRCALALAISANLEAMASDMFVDWVDYEADSPADLLRALFEGLVEQFRAIIELKLLRPIGDTAASANPKRAEAWRSRLSLPAIRANLFAMRGLLVGENGIYGLSVALPTDTATTQTLEALNEHLTYGIGRLEAQSTSLYEAIETAEGRDFVKFFTTHLAATRDLCLDVFPEALDVAAGFNSLDGD